ncbi:hypothetical protein GCM10018790_12180 [Kitasatospora xanthocidica]|uniref:hypothetical protein n=1 Tax=Kitasatospora xanthocidica TaxID=83382 RepID=UPI001675C911|nr:hypothetical protein [Kitasatospora xanthocidica]GHF35782.1 hypothetical protein GCM10018790_12180 [Kitasatospora xanthocidica]
MGMSGRRMAAGVAAGVLMAVLAGCSSGGSKTAAGTASGTPGAAVASTAAGSAPAATAPADPSAASAAASAAASGAASAPASAPAPAAAAPSADLEAALLDDKLVGQVLPDAKVMAGWEEEKRKVDTADHAVTCTAATSCAGKPLSASVRFSSGDVVTRFIVETLPSRDAAKNRLKETYASYAAGPFKKVDTPALGSESQAFQGPLAEGEGVGIVVRSGTVVASVTTEGGPVDVAATRRFAVMLVKRIEQAQAGKTPDAGPALG